MHPKSKKILITGGSGYLGTKLLVDFHHKYEVLGITRRKCEARSYDLIYKKNWDRTALRQIICHYKPDVIIHNAAYAKLGDKEEDFKSCYESNILFTQHLLEACKEVENVHFINMSSYSAFNVDGSATNDSYYGISKTIATELCKFFSRNKNIRVTNLVLYDVFGDADPRKTKVYNLIIDKVSKQKKVDLTAGLQEINFIHVSDVLRAIELVLIAASRDAFEEFSVKGPVTTTLRKHLYRLVEDEKLSKLINFGGYVDHRRKSDLIYTDIKQVPHFKPKINFSDWIFKKIIC
jgi:nucleoside-diphosphate-sugar epimerase